jgi:hypothetical protein
MLHVTDDGDDDTEVSNILKQAMILLFIKFSIARA